MSKLTGESVDFMYSLQSNRWDYAESEIRMGKDYGVRAISSRKVYRRN